MQHNFSGSKRKNINRSLLYESNLSNSRIQGQGLSFTENYPTRNGYGDQRRMDKSRRSASGIKNPYQDPDKQNCNYIQARLDKYETPICSPLKQQLYSPIKYAPNLYEPMTGRRALNRITSKNDPLNDSQHLESYSNRQISKREVNSFNDYPSSRNSYKKAPQKTSFNYETESIREYQNRDQVPLSSRGPYKSNAPLGITFSNNTPYVTNIISTTPKKGNNQLDQLVEKSEFLKQKLERLSRMTPKGCRKAQERQITPEKLNFKQTKQPYKVVKHNKYCDEKLPLETIYDADEHRHGREKTEEGEQGIQQINDLSRKISDRLKNIISRHNN